MKAWLTRYLTETSNVALFFSISLLGLLIAVLIQLIGSTVLELIHFAQLVERAKVWLLPVRLLIYAGATRYWLGHCRRVIENSANPDIERRVRNRISGAGVLYMAAVEYGCWAASPEVQLQ